MIQQKVNEIRFAFHLYPILAAGKCEHASHFTQEDFHFRDKSVLQLAFAMFFPQFEKIKGLFIFNRQPRLVADIFGDGRLKVCLIQ